MEAKLQMTNGTGSYLESIPIEIALRHFFHFKKAFVVGQILLRLKQAKKGFMPRLPEPRGKLSEADSGWENWIPQEVAETLDRTERDQLTEALKKCGQNGGYDETIVETYCPLGRPDPVRPNGAAQNQHCEGTYLGKMEPFQWIHYIPEEKREVVQDLFHFSMNLECLDPVDPDLIPPLVAKAAGLHTAHRILETLPKGAESGVQKEPAFHKMQRDGNVVETIIPLEVAQQMDQEELTAVCTRLEMLEKHSGCGVSADCLGVIPTSIAEVLTPQEQDALAQKLLTHWAQEHIIRAGFF